MPQRQALGQQKTSNDETETAHWYTWVKTTAASKRSHDKTVSSYEQNHL